MTSQPALTPNPVVPNPMVFDELPHRYELKYLISCAQADAVRRAIQLTCALDPHGAHRPDGQYEVQSLYLDTPERDLYRMSRERHAHRWKARIRRYDDSDHVFLEIKNKDSGLISKQRVSIPACDWSDRVRSRPGPHASPAMRAFCERVEHHRLVPTLMVHYLREAWSSTLDGYLRVTFDRRVVGQPWGDWAFETDERGWRALDSRRLMTGVPDGLVLELKCQTSVPYWLANVVRSQGLVRASYSKYCKGIERHFAREGSRFTPT